MTITALINTESGSVPRDAEAALKDIMGDNLESVTVCEGSDLKLALSDQIFKPDDTFIVWGGDGTIAAALNAISATGASVLPLPGGTMNLVHKRIHGELGSWEDILRDALRSPAHDLTYGRANGHKFYVALMLGRLTDLSELREAIRDGAAIEAAKAALSSDALTLASDLVAMFGNKTEAATAGAAFLPETVDGKIFEIGLIDPGSLLELASTSLRALIDDWRTAEGVTFHEADALSFSHVDNVQLKGLLDGEPVTLSSPAQISIMTGDVLVRSASDCK